MFGLSSGISALSAARLAIQTVGNNLANSTTPGYSRERVILESGRPTLIGSFYQGGGVRVGSLERVTDELLLDRVRNQNHEVARRNITFQAMLGVEAAFGEPSDTAFSGQLTSFFSSLSSLATSPADNVQKKGVIFGGGDIADQLQRIRRDLSGNQEGIESLIQNTAATVNAIAESIASVNAEITKTQGFGEGPPAALLDRQGQLIDQLSQFVDVSVQPTGAGRVDIRVGGQMIVSSNSTTQMTASRNEDGEVGIYLEGSPYEVDVRGGELRGYIDLSKSGVGDRIDELDDLASAMILNFNRIHSTGVPAGGGFTSLSSNYPVVDTDNDGILGDSLLSASGFPFEPSEGRLWVSVVNDSTGDIEQTSIAVDPDLDTVQGFIDKLNDVDGLSASLDATGRLRLNAESGSRFHFGAALDTNPNSNNTLGSSQGQILGAMSEPFALTSGDSLSISVNGGAPQNVVFSPSQFLHMGSATADEVASAIQSSLVGATASVENGQVIVTSNTNGVASTIQITDGAGSPASAFGLSTALDTGSTQNVGVTIGGQYDGTEDQEFTFRPLGEGTIGLTPGLKMEVVNAQGQVVSTLDVGQGYSPDSELDVVSGITVSFGPGEISKAAGDFVTLPAFADSDDSDILASFGLNAFFVGSNAEDIAVAASLADDPETLSLAMSGAASDNRNILRMLTLRDGALDSLGNRSAEEFYNGIVAEVGQTTNRAALNLETESLLKESFENRLESVRGVSVDEELADLQRYEQAYQAAARYITAVNEMSQVLFNL
ncbi:MAG: flagellar hook-associated protein FlgK [Planctomycetota bacterium]|jgi:flagellar hook-associated protein FlgK